MSKAIMLSIKPEWVAKILNGEKTIEVRKKFPKDYVGWVYIYCTKGTPKTQLVDNRNYNNKFELCWFLKDEREQLKKYIVNGKVVARFYCDKVEKYVNSIYSGKCCDYRELLNKSCLTYEQISDYLKDKNGYAVHIKNLKVFDKPIELEELKHKVKYPNCNKCPYGKTGDYGKCGLCYDIVPLTKAPQNYCYVEVE